MQYVHAVLVAHLDVRPLLLQVLDHPPVAPVGREVQGREVVLGLPIDPDRHRNLDLLLVLAEPSQLVLHVVDEEDHHWVRVIEGREVQQRVPLLVDDIRDVEVDVLAELLLHLLDVVVLRHLQEVPLERLRAVGPPPVVRAVALHHGVAGTHGAARTH